MREGSPDRVTLGAFGLVVAIAGINFVAVRFSNQELPPFWGAALRFATASVLLFLIVAARKRPLPQGRALLGAVLYGILAFGASYAFAYYALVAVRAGLASVVLALVPLTTFFFAVAHRVERFRWLGLVGALFAVAGIALVYREQISADVPVLSLLSLLAAAASIAESSLVIKRFPKADPFATNAVAMATGTFLLLALSFATNEPHALPSQSRTWLAVSYLVVVGSVLLFMAYLFVLTRWTASATSYQFVLSPLVTVAVAAWLAGETVTPTFAVGGLLVIVGVYVGALHRRPAGPPRLPAETMSAEMSASPPKPVAADEPAGPRP